MHRLVAEAAAAAIDDTYDTNLASEGGGNRRTPLAGWPLIHPVFDPGGGENGARLLFRGK
jgi:hypothetical protein